MKKFKFRLEKVLQFRLVVKGEKLRELNVAQKKLRDAQDHLEHLNAEFGNNKIADGQIMMVDEIQIKGAYGERLKAEIAQQGVLLLNLEEELETARNIYVEASRDAEVLEKLKEKKKSSHTELVLKEEEKFLDELTTQKGNTISIQSE